MALTAVLGPTKKRSGTVAYGAPARVAMPAVGGGGGERAYATGVPGAAPPRVPSADPPGAPAPYPGGYQPPAAAPPVAPQQVSGPTKPPFAGLVPSDYFGGVDPGGTAMGEGGPFTMAPGGQMGSGLYGLPSAFSNWQSAARYSLAPALQFQTDSESVVKQLGDEAGKDYQSELYGMSSDAAEAQFSDSRRKQQQALAQAGYGGGGTVSPFAAQQLQLEGQARAGVLGNAARQSVMQAQQMRAEASRSFLNALSQRMQAMLTPAMLQSAGVTKTPTGSTGPSYIGPALQLGASALNALA